MTEKSELKKCDFIKCDGVCVFEYDISFPMLNISKRCDKRIGRLLECAYQNALSRARALGARAEEEYRNDEGEKKRFYFRPYRYIFKCSVTGDDGECLTLLFDGKIERRGKALSSERREVTVRRRSGLFILPKKIKKQKECKQ